MAYFIAIIVSILFIVFLLNRHKKLKATNADKVKILEYERLGFPKFSEAEQFEMLYSNNFELIFNRLQVRSISNRYFDSIFSITVDEVKKYIRENKDLIRDRNVNLNQFEGYWVEKENSDYLYHYRDRGQIQYTWRFANEDELIEKFVNDLVNIIPKYSTTQLETVLIKR